MDPNIRNVGTFVLRPQLSHSSRHGAQPGYEAQDFQRPESSSSQGVRARTDIRRGSPSQRRITERTPLIPVTYYLHPLPHRRYQKRLWTLQCATCIMITMFLLTTCLVAMSYNMLAEPVLLKATEPQLSDQLLPLLNKTWPLLNREIDKWSVENPTEKQIVESITRGKLALENRRKLEMSLKPLERNTAASRAQSAVATAASVKPWADNAFVVEEAMRILVNSTNTTILENVGRGPATTGLIEEAAHCQQQATSCILSKYRALDGTCNNLNNPTWGVSNTPYRRSLPAHYDDGISAPRKGINDTKLPSARDVSVTIHRPSYSHDTNFTVMLAVWGQLVDHDITAMALSKGVNNSGIKCCGQPPPSHPECFPVELDVEDPFYYKYNITCMEFVRSAPAFTCHFGPRDQLNQATSYIDASTVYGYNEITSKGLREGVGGKLKMLTVDGRELLPPSLDPHDGCNTEEMAALGRYCFASGDSRANENLHLTTMHLIWARQHNRVAAELQRLNPEWSDDVLFQETRRILSAQMQYITYSEFLPVILGAGVMDALNMTLKEVGYSDAYDPTVNPTVANHFAAAAFRFAHTLLPGLIHTMDSNKSSPSYIHLHEILFNPFALYLSNGSIFSMHSAMNTPVNCVNPHVTAELTEHLFERPVLKAESSGTLKKGRYGLDLVSLNIQRGRDHGLRTYPSWREHCGLSRPTSFDDLKTIFNNISLTRISQIYNHVEDIDLYTGGLAEDPRGRLLGPLLTCLIADQFLKLKIGDRFWYESDDPKLRFTLEQLAEIRKTSLAGIVCANERLLDVLQPKIMETAKPTNPLTRCENIPQPSFDPWIELIEKK